MVEIDLPYSTIDPPIGIHEAKTVEIEPQRSTICGSMVEYQLGNRIDEGSSVELCRQKESVRGSCVEYWPGISTIRTLATAFPTSSSSG
jgi:hypothetical protein